MLQSGQQTGSPAGRLPAALQPLGPASLRQKRAAELNQSASLRPTPVRLVQPKQSNLASLSKQAIIAQANRSNLAVTLRPSSSIPFSSCRQEEMRQKHNSSSAQQSVACIAAFASTCLAPT